ncbi:MAG: hypothetical protein ACE5EB_05740 [Thermodesulfobacteriota bacterium]
MSKSVRGLKDILKREERLVEKLRETIALMAHKESKDFVKGFLKNKRAEIREYKKILKRSEKCPAVKKPGRKCKA